MDCIAYVNGGLLVIREATYIYIFLSYKTVTVKLDYCLS